MSRIVGSRRDLAIGRFRRQWTPLITVVIASLLHLFPVVVQTPIVPDLAFLVLVAWRLLRPEMWAAPIALPLGLFNDLMAGHPLGQSMAIWTVTFLVFDLVDSRVGWRDYWMDWLFAAAAIAFSSFGGWYIARLMGSEAPYMVMVPQLVVSILFYPVVARIVLALDRWRLAR